MLKHSNSSGQSLVEAIIAFSAIIAIMTATTVAVVSSLNNAGFVKSQTQVNKLAQEGMEYIRDGIVARNQYGTYASYGGLNTRCLGEDYNLSYVSNCPGANVQSKFRRTATFDVGQCESGGSFNNGLRVSVKVEWKDSKCVYSTSFCHSQQITSCFFDPSRITVPTTAQGI